MSSKADSLRSIERELGVLLRRVRRKTAVNARTIHPDLQPTAYSILLHVVEQGPGRAAQIVDDLGIDKGAVSRQVAHLENLGLVARSTDPADGRAQRIEATALGHRRIAALRQERRSDFAGRLSGWSADDLTELAERLARYNASLEP